MKKLIIFAVSLFFISGISSFGEITPVKRSLYIELPGPGFSIPTKKPVQPALSQLLSNKDYELFELALDKADEYKWDRVVGISENINNETAKETLNWLRYYNGASNLTFSDYKKYIEKNSNWPEIEKIKLKAETKITFRDNYDDLINYFRDNPPETGWGRIYLGNALLNSGKSEEGKRLIIDGYISGSFTRKEQSQIIKTYKSILNKDHHLRRINKLLWDGKYRTAARLVK